MQELTTAIRAVESAVTRTPRTSERLSPVVQHRLRALRDAYLAHLTTSLDHDTISEADCHWLASRADVLRREQTKLAGEIDRVIDGCGPEASAESVRTQVLGLLSRISRSRRRENDLWYESVSLDLGGEQ